MSTSVLYQPLVQNSRSIRLLELSLETTASETISCTLHHIDDIDKCPPYTALSYRWGPENPQVDILLDGTTFKVRENLVLALWALKKRIIDSQPESVMWKYLFVDAICINQLDGLEKNHQVNLMSSIYSKAELVVSWLGEEKDDSAVAFKLLRSREPETTKLLKELSGQTENHPMRGFFGRSYWERLWIVQEILLAKQAIILCGDEICSWDDVDHQFSVYTFNLVHSRSFRNERHLKHRDVVWSLVMHRKNTFEICSVFQAFATQKCELPHDNIYGLLGLVPQEVKQSQGILSADYAKSPVEVLRGLTIYLAEFATKLGHGTNIDIVHTLAHQMGIKPPQSLRMTAAKYLGLEFVSDREMENLYAYTGVRDKIARLGAPGILWDATTPDPWKVPRDLKPWHYS
jgi:hypothetical protein